MKYEITITPAVTEDNNEVTLSLNTADGGQFEIKSYGATMGFTEFVEFADAVHEIREKYAKLQGNG